MRATNRVFVVVAGGHVTNVDVPGIVDGTHSVIDFDLAEEDAGREWATYDDLDRAYIRENYPEECSLYFGECV
jgi:hypothetical protein